jgi:very-short-patch-repair endonuclease
MNVDLSALPSTVITRIVRGQPRKERRYALKCEECGRTRMVNAQQSRSKICKRCASRRAGKKGYAATVAKHGRDFFFETVRRHQLENPSAPESLIIAVLHEMGVGYARQVALETADGGRYLIDFVIGGRYAIEYDGYHHVYHEQRDERKHAAMCGAGYKVLHLAENDFADGLGGVKHLVAAFVGAVTA